ncbi:MAG TPA: glycerophosphodiester phosphodiesterase family protein [Phycisphaerae bacterium]|nr:glycerophosphodiester phosphodiesterase family protein [Phycisphaerae bacterium]
MMNVGRRWATAFALAAAMCAVGLAALGSAGDSPERASSSQALAWAVDILAGRADGVLVVAHRARSRTGAVENSLEALSWAMADGVPMVELDVRLTRDDCPVLMHDPSLRRTAGVQRNVDELDLAALRQHRLEGNGEPIQTLDEALAKAGGQMLLVLDVKVDRLAPVVRAIEHADAFETTLVYVTPARRERAAVELTWRYPRLRVMMRAGGRDDVVRIKGHDPRPAVIQIDGRRPDRQLCQEIRDAGVLVFVYPRGWTRLRFGNDLNRYRQMGVTFVQTDRPTAMLEQMRQINLPATMQGDRNE